MLTKKQIRGKFGEKIALQYLERKGYRLIRKNYKKRSGEIDIIVKSPDNKGLVFIEVKTRTSEKFGAPEEAVDFYKQGKLLKTCEYFILENPAYEKMPWQIDVISIEMNFKTRRARLRHLKDVVREA